MTFPITRKRRLRTRYGTAARLVTNGIDSGFAPYELRRRLIDEQVRPWFATRVSG